jgi:hypothetical protein
MALLLMEIQSVLLFVLPGYPGFVKAEKASLRGRMSV